MTRLLPIAALTMVAFASNSILNRAALTDGETGPAAFAAIRTLSGALCLMALATLRQGAPRLIRPGRWIGTASLLVYMLGFSFAYVALDAGTGALILFGGVIMLYTGWFEWNGTGSEDRPTCLRPRRTRSSSGISRKATSWFASPYTSRVCERL